MVDTKRVTYVDTKERIESLDEIADEVGLNRNQVMKDACKFFIRYIGRLKKGYDIEYVNSKDPNDRFKTLLPMYDHLRPKR